MADSPVITSGAFDSQNLAFWDGARNEYRAYWRIFTQGVTDEKNWKPEGHRAIRTATSRNFIDWENQKDLTYEDSPIEHLYTNQVKPYHRAPHLLLGFPTRYVERGWSESMRALPEGDHREARAKASLRYGTAITEALLMTSRDGVAFKRWNEAFLPPGIERPGTWNYVINTSRGTSSKRNPNGKVLPMNYRSTLQKTIGREPAVYFGVIHFEWTDSSRSTHP